MAQDISDEKGTAAQPGFAYAAWKAPSDNTPEFAVEDLTEGLDDLNFGDKKKKKKKKPAAEVVRQQLCFPFNACV